MISKCADEVTNFLVRKTIIVCEEKDIYKYGFELIISTLVNLFWILVIGVIYNEVLMVLISFFIFASVRTQCGGYHASTYFKCNVYLIIVFNLILLSTHYFEAFYMSRPFCVLMYIYVPVFLWVFSPVESLQNPIDSEEHRNKIKVKVLIKTIIWEIAGFACWFFGWKDLTVLIIITFDAVCILLVLEVERRKRQNEKYR